MQQSQPRDLVWDGCFNVRDLGGLPTHDGGETRRGAVVRADSVRQLSTEGWRALVAHGIRTAIDLRGDDERADDASVEPPIEVVHRPFFAANAAEWAAIRPELDATVAVAPDIPTATRDVYLLYLARFQANVASAVQAIAHAADGGVVIHCVGGKDRTGLLSAFLLHLAGVDDELIATDYALSGERLRPRHDAWFAAAESEEELERLRRIAQTPARSMLGVLEELDRRYGGVEAYLSAAGVGEEELRLVRARLRG